MDWCWSGLVGIDKILGFIWTSNEMVIKLDCSRSFGGIAGGGHPKSKHWFMLSMIASSSPERETYFLWGLGGLSSSAVQAPQLAE